MNKKCFILLFILLAVLQLTGCGAKKDASQSSNLVIDYLLTTDNGKVVGYTAGGAYVSEVDLNGTKNSDFEYYLDQGDLYTYETSTHTNKNSVLYALDKNKGKVYVIGVGKDTLTKITSKNLKTKDIDSAYAYNGTFYYATKQKNKFANKVTYIKPEKDKLNGIIDYGQTISIGEVRDLNTYIMFEDFTDEYLKARGLDTVVSSTQRNELFPKINGVFELPGDVTSWLANGEYIYFFMEDYMGIYLMQKDQIGIFYSTPNVPNVEYLDGKDKRVIAIANLGDESYKSLLMEFSHHDLRIQNAVGIDTSNILDMAIDGRTYVHTLHKNESGDTPTKLKTYNYKDYSEVSSTTLKFIPTKIDASNNFVYLFNPYEEYFLIGDAGVTEFSKRSNMIDGEKFTDILAIENRREDTYYYDENGRYVDGNNHLIDKDGNLINQENERLNMYGQKVDIYGRAIDEEGNFLDRYNNIIDENGEILSYTKGKDGYYRNSQGNPVDQTGKHLVLNEEGVWVDEIPKERPLIPGYYDESGKFIIDTAYLKMYPDAYEYLEEHGESVILKYETADTASASPAASEQ